VIILVLQPLGFIGIVLAFHHVMRLLLLTCKQDFSTVISLVCKISSTIGMDLVIPLVLLLFFKKLLEDHLLGIIAIILAKPQSFSIGTTLAYQNVTCHLLNHQLTQDSFVILLVTSQSISTLTTHVAPTVHFHLLREEKLVLDFAIILLAYIPNMLQLGTMNAYPDVIHP